MCRISFLVSVSWMSVSLHAGIKPPRLLICVEHRACLLWLVLTLCRGKLTVTSGQQSVQYLKSVVHISKMSAHGLKLPAVPPMWTFPSALVLLFLTLPLPPLIYVALNSLYLWLHFPLGAIVDSHSSKTCRSDSSQRSIYIFLCML